MSRVLFARVLSQCVRSEHYHLKVHLNISMVKKEVKVPITLQIWLIYGRNIRGIVTSNALYCIQYIHQSTNQFSVAYLKMCHSGSTFSKVTQTSPQPHYPAPPRGSQGVPWPDEIYYLSSMFWVCPGSAPSRTCT